jgi:fucose 4-O-acetylase-like acetyltransferase
MQRVGWIDFLRGISMILILVFHTEMYYKEYDVTPYYIYTTNAIILFYFISGYLFYRPESFSLKKKALSIVRSLLIPYFIFTTLIAIPKVLVRQENVDWIDISLKIISGRASWFIAALIVGELFFALLLTKTRGKIPWLLIDAIGCLVIYYIIPFNQHNYWQWQDALLAITFLSTGYFYHQYEKHFHTINKLLYSLILLLILIFIKLYEYHVDLPMRNIAIENIPLFIADAFIWLLFIISIIRYIPRCEMIEWTGQHSIVYYFLAGGCPLIISILFNKVGCYYDGYWYRYVIALIFVYTLATILTWLIYKYVPFITGRIKK